MVNVNSAAGSELRSRSSGTSGVNASRLICTGRVSSWYSTRPNGYVPLKVVEATPSARASRSRCQVGTRSSVTSGVLVLPGGAGGACSTRTASNGGSHCEMRTAKNDPGSSPRWLPMLCSCHCRRPPSAASARLPVPIPPSGMATCRPSVCDIGRGWSPVLIGFLPGGSLQPGHLDVGDDLPLEHQEDQHHRRRGQR